MAAAEDTPPGFAPDFFDRASGGQEPPDLALRRFATDLEATARENPAWVIDTAGGRPVRLSPARDGAVAFESLGVQGTVTLSAGAAGWVRLTVTIDGAVAFAAFAERVWEDCDLYPPASPGRAMQENAPGTLGRRRNHLSLSARAWPQLAPLANPEGWVLLQIAED
jgi:hypothetical protein